MANLNDRLSGLLFILIGGGFALASWAGLRLGTASQMGPGYFPMLVSGLLIVFGVVILFKTGEPAEAERNPVAWRGLLMVSLATASFALFVRSLGFGPAMMLSVMLACFASPRMTYLAAFLTSISLTAFCSAVFIYALGLPFPMLGYLLRS